MNIAVLGAGAIGAYYGSRLEQVGHNVSFVSKSSVDQYQITSIDGDFTLKDIHHFLSDAPPCNCDLVLIATKTTENNHNLISTVRKMIKNQATPLLVLQNGYANETFFLNHFPENPVLGGLCYIAVSKQGVKVNHTANGWIVLGKESADVKTLHSLENILSQANIKTTLTQDLRQARWHKLLWNIPFNALSVIYQKAPCELANNTVTRKIITNVMTEVLEASKATLHPVERADADKLLTMTEKMPKTKPSMLLDYKLKRPLEINYMYDQPIRAARKFGYEMKQTIEIVNQLKTHINL